MKLYIVKQGDTMSAIAEKYGLDVQQLIAANPSINDPDVISPGMKIRIPSASAMEPTFHEAPPVEEANAFMQIPVAPVKAGANPMPNQMPMMPDFMPNSQQGPPYLSTIPQYFSHNPVYSGTAMSTPMSTPNPVPVNIQSTYAPYGIPEYPFSYSTHAYPSTYGWGDMPALPPVTTQGYDHQPKPCGCGGGGGTTVGFYSLYEQRQAERMYNLQQGQPGFYESQFAETGSVQEQTEQAELQESRELTTVEESQLESETQEIQETLPAKGLPAQKASVKSQAAKKRSRRSTKRK